MHPSGHSANSLSPLIHIRNQPLSSLYISLSLSLSCYCLHKSSTWDPLCFWNSHTYQAFLYLSTVAHTVLLSEMLISNLCLLKFSLSCKSQFKWLLLWSLTSLLLPIWHPVFLLLRALLFSFWVSCPLHFQSMRFSWGQPGMDVWCGSANHYTTWQWLAQT